MTVTEGKIQQQIVMWFRNNHCTKLSIPRCAIFSVPNERNNKKEMMSMIQTGLMSGVSDLILLLPNKAVFVEVKTDVGRQSDKQKEFQKIVTALGFEYWLVRSLEDFINKLQK
jgi:hypothetical protein